jgi:hypothetical protein
METRQQSNNQQQEQAPVVARTRGSSSYQVDFKKGVRVVEENNSTKVFNRFNRRIILPTQSNCPSTASILKHRPKYTTDTNMPPRKKQKAAPPKPRAVNFTELEDIFICKAWICNYQNAVTSTNQNIRQF